MITTRASLDDFVRDAAAFARVFSAHDLFSLLNRQIIVPTSCAALVWTEATQPLLVSGGRPIEADGTREVLVVKTAAFPLEYTLSGLRSHDDYEFAALVRLAVQVVPERTELLAVRDAIVGSLNRADTRTLTAYFEEAVRQATASFTRSHDAEALLSPRVSADYDAKLAEHFRPVSFSAGMALGRDPRITFSSASFDASRRLDQEHALRSQRLKADDQLRSSAAEGRRKHLTDLSAVLDEVRTLAAKNPGVAVGDLIRRFDLSQRGELYRGLMASRADAARTQAVLVVAGEELIWLDPANPSQPMRRQSLPTAGPLRSVRVMREGLHRIILIGARRGVHVIDAEEGPRPTYTFEPGRELRGGVNAAVLHRGHLYATHSEMGLLCWEIIKADAAESILPELTRAAKSVRDVQFAYDRLWFTADHHIVGCPPVTGASASTAAEPLILTAPGVVQSLCVTAGRVYGGLESGELIEWSIDPPNEPRVLMQSGGGPVQSVVWLAGGGIPRLLIADHRSHLSLLAIGEPSRGEYPWRQPLRWAAAADDVIVGVNDLRDQVILWKPEVPEEPMAGVSIGRLCGQSVQDVALLTSPTPGVS